MKRSYIIYGIIIILLIAGALFAWRKPAQVPAPVTVTPPIIQPTPTPVAPVTPIPPAATAAIKDFSQAKEDCKNEQCQKILAEFQKFIDAPILDTKNWLVYENKKEGFNFKYPSEWIKKDPKTRTSIFVFK